MCPTVRLIKLLKLLVAWSSLLSATCNASFGQDLYALTTYESDTYASSTIGGSRSDFAIDADFEAPEPTCFVTDPNLPDFEGYHWLLVDLKMITHSIKEIRLIMGANESGDRKPQSVDAYVITSMDIPKAEIQQRVYLQKPSLSWDLPTFQHCATSTFTGEDGRTLEFHCSLPLVGRWVAIRSDDPLNICLLNVLLKSAFDQCFEVDEPVSKDFQGTIYRYIRHTPFNACRVACMRDPKCEAMLFTKLGRSGTCQLVHSFGLANSTKRPHSSAREELICQNSECLLDVNHCHEGIMNNLQKVVTSSTEGTQLPDVAFVHAIAQFVEDWRIMGQPTIATIANYKTYLLSLYLDGELYCSEWNCGLIYVYSVNHEGSETLCTIINTEQIVSLNEARHFCNRDNPPVNPHLLRLKWNPAPIGQYDQQPKLTVNISSGHVRISHEIVRTYYNVRKLDKSTPVSTVMASYGTTMTATQELMTSTERMSTITAPVQKTVTVNSTVIDDDEVHNSMPANISTSTRQQNSMRITLNQNNLHNDHVLEFPGDCEECDIILDQSEEGNQLNDEAIMSTAHSQSTTERPRTLLDKDMKVDKLLPDRKLFQHRGASLNHFYRIDSNGPVRNIVHVKRAFSPLLPISIGLFIIQL